MIELSVQRGAAFQTQRVNLDGSEFLLTLDWNTRVGAWHMTLATLDNEVIFAGVKVISNRPLAKMYRYDARMPPGGFIAYDSSGAIDQAGFDELGDSVSLMYVEAEDL